MLPEPPGIGLGSRGRDIWGGTEGKDESSQGDAERGCRLRHPPAWGPAFPSREQLVRSVARRFWLERGRSQGSLPPAAVLAAPFALTPPPDPSTARRVPPGCSSPPRAAQPRPAPRARQAETRDPSQHRGPLLGAASATSSSDLAFCKATFRRARTPARWEKDAEPRPVRANAEWGGGSPRFATLGCTVPLTRGSTKTTSLKLGVWERARSDREASGGSFPARGSRAHPGSLLVPPLGTSCPSPLGSL